jgi:NitT/TauT family transport system substrate-binding protein
MQKRSLLYALHAVFILAVLLSACQPTPIAQTDAQLGPLAEPIKLKIAILPFISFAPYFIAQEEGFFTSRGLEVEFVNLVTQQDSIAALLSGEVEITAGLMTAGLLNSMARGANIRIVADKGYIDPEGCNNIAMIASKQLVTEGQEVDAELLRGETMNVVVGSWNEYYADKLLGTVGLSTSDFESNNVPSPGQLEALDQGTVDVTVNNEPWVTRFKNAGHPEVLGTVTDVLPESQAAIMLYGPTLLEENIDAGNRFMVAYLQAVQQYNQGKTDRNIEILTKHMELEPEVLKDMCWPTIRANGSLNNDSILDFQSWAVQKGLAEQTLEIENLVDKRFLEFAVPLLGLSD